MLNSFRQNHNVPKMKSVRTGASAAVIAATSAVTDDEQSANFPCQLILRDRIVNDAGAVQLFPWGEPPS